MKKLNIDKEELRQEILKLVFEKETSPRLVQILVEMFDSYAIKWHNVPEEFRDEALLNFLSYDDPCNEYMIKEGKSGSYVRRNLPGGLASIINKFDPTLDNTSAFSYVTGIMNNHLLYVWHHYTWELENKTNMVNEARANYLNETSTEEN